MKHLTQLFGIVAKRVLPHIWIDFAVSGYSGRFSTGSSSLHQYSNHDLHMNVICISLHLVFNLYTKQNEHPRLRDITQEGLALQKEASVHLITVVTFHALVSLHFSIPFSSNNKE